MVYKRLFGFPSWDRKSAFGELDLMRHQMERLFDDLSQRRGKRADSGVFPAVNLTEDADSYYARAELPGVAANDLDIQATVNSLSLSGERKMAETEKNAKYHRRERESGKFSRVLNLPEAVDAGRIEARLKNGLLTVTIPKSEMAKPRQISIK